MESEIEGRVARAAEALRAYELLRQHADDLRRRARQLELRVPELTERHAAEQRDVDKLEGVSLARLLVALRGARDDALERERAEAAQARFRLAEIQDQLSAVRDELTTTRTELDRRAAAHTEFTAALAAKEAYLRGSDDVRLPPLLALAEERGRLTGELREIAEAETAAVRAATALASVEKIMRSAEDWSTFDTYFGGGWVSSSVKHHRLDEAAQAASYADRCLAVLRTELADIGRAGPADMNVEVTGSTRFVDVWFDNVVTDFRVHDRIKTARRNVARSQARVTEVRKHLTDQARRATERVAAIEAERRALLVA